MTQTKNLFRVARRMWARDIFISYSRADGAVYALGLAAKLSERNFACVIDQWGMSTPGTATPDQLRQLLRNCRAFILIGTRGSAASVHVEAEIEEFVKTSGMIIPIDLDGSLREARWWPTIEGLPIAIESGGVTAREPDREVLARITNALTFRRRDQRLRTIALTTASLLALMVVAIGGLAYQSRKLVGTNEDVAKKLAASGVTLAEVRQQAGEVNRQLSATSKVLTGQQRALSAATRDVKTAQSRAQIALARASTAQSQASAAEKRAQSARLEADRQQRLANQLSAQNLVSAAALQVDKDPAVSVRLIEAAVEIDPDLDIRDILVNAAVNGPAWNRFPAFPPNEYHGELTPSSSSDVPIIAADPTVRAIAHIDPDNEGRLLIMDVDSGRTIRAIALRPDETVMKLRPYARELLVLNSRGRVRIFDFAALTLATGDTQPVFETTSRALDCANGSWPCVTIAPDGMLRLISRDGAQLRSTELGQYPRATRLYIHPSGHSIAIVDSDTIHWLAKQESWSSLDRRDIAVTGYGDYPHEEEPLPWIRWGPEPDQLLVAEPDFGAGGRRPSTSLGAIQLWAIRARTGQRQNVMRWDLELNGLALPVFETDVLGQRLAWTRMARGSGSQLQIAKLNWRDPAASDIVEVKAPEEAALRGAASSEAEYSVQTAALAPNGAFVVIGADTRGLSGTQVGYGALESWNLEPLDEDGSRRPEARKIPIAGRRHAKQIIYAQNALRVAVLDDEKGVSIFKVRDGPGPDFNEDLRMDDDLLDHLAPHTYPLDARNSAWLSIYGEHDRRIYDLATGLETDVGGGSLCGAALAAQRMADATIIASSTCVARLRDGKIAERWNLPEPAVAATISHGLVSVKTSNTIFFLRVSDLAPLGSARLTDNSVLADLVSKSGSESSAPDIAAYFPTLDLGGTQLSALRLSDDHRLEKWMATLGSVDELIKFKLIWSRQFAKSGWSSMRRLAGADIILLLLGSNTPGDVPELFPLNDKDGSAAPYVTPPPTMSPLFEVAAAGRLDHDSIFGVLRLSKGGLIVGVWSKSGPPRFLPIATETDSLSGGDVLGVQVIDSEQLLFLRGARDKKVLSAVSLQTGDTVWTGHLDESLPAPMLERSPSGWAVVNQVALARIANRIRSGGGLLYDAITRIKVPPEQIERLVGRAR